MHPSYFQIVEINAVEQKDLTLSGEVSEWLVCTHFWDQMNERYGTFFGQYEEECLPENLTNDVAKCLRTLIGQIEITADQAVRFRYGWNEKKEDLECSIEIATLKRELENLSHFFDEAAVKKADVYCQI